MPRKTKDAPGRVTPKGGAPKKKGTASTRSGSAASSGRYTAPIPREMRTSAPWVPYLIVTLFALGVLVILLNYLGVLGNASNIYLFIGLGLIVAGFIAATRWH